MKNRLAKYALLVSVATVAVTAAIILLAQCAFALGASQVIVELQNGGSGETHNHIFPSQEIRGVSPGQAYKYQREREGKNFSYVVANLYPSTAYQVDLCFVEHDFSSAGRRVFNVYIQGTKVLGSLDIFARAGKDRAYKLAFWAATDANGMLVVTFRSDQGGCANYATISTVTVYQGTQTAVEINALASRNNMDVPVRFSNSSSQNTYECLLSRLGSRFNLDLAPQRLASRISSLGTGSGDLAELVMALNCGGTVRALPFTDRFPVWEGIGQSQTMTSQTFACSSGGMPFQVTVAFRAPFYPRNEAVSGAPFVYADVTVTNVSPAATSGTFLFARPQKQVFGESYVTEFANGTKAGVQNRTTYNLHEETYNADRRTAYEALAVPAGEAADMDFKGSVETEFNDFTGDRLWGWDSPAGYPATYYGPTTPIYSFYPRGYTGATWDVSLLPGTSAVKHFVLAGHIAESVLRVNNNAYKDYSFKFKYKNWFSGVQDVVNYAITSRWAGDRIEDKCAFFDATISSGEYLNLNPSYAGDVRNLIAYSFQSYLANTWWACSDAGREWFSVWEGSNCRYHSTVDVEYNQSWFYLDYWPDLLRYIMDEWALYKRTSDQGTYLSHDMGYNDAATGQSYGHNMAVEENANYILLLYKYWKSTGDRTAVDRRFYLVRQLVDFMINCDNNNNGLPDLYTENTLDDGSPAIERGRDQAYLGIKCLGAFQAAREMAAGLSSPDGTTQKKCEGRVELINQSLEYDLWLSDHYAVCLDGSVAAADREAYSMHPANGLLYLLGSARNVGVTSGNVARLKTDIVNSTEKTLKKYGCTHSSYDAYNEWVSSNLWRDQVACQLGSNLHGANPLLLSKRYWSLEQYFATQMNGGYWDVLMYPGGSGRRGASAEKGTGRRQSGTGAGSGYSQSLGYYPRGIASLGLIDAVAGLSIDVPAGCLFYEPTTYPLRVPIFARADWNSGIVPTIYFRDTRSAPQVSYTGLLPPTVTWKSVRDLKNVTGGRHAISPDGDGVNDKVTVSYKLPMQANVQNSVWEGGSRKRRYGKATQSGTKSFTWDGKDDKGSVVPDGLYTARIDANARNRSYSLRPASAPVWVNTSVSDLSQDWYLAEGFTGRNATGGDFEEYVLIQNPNDDPAFVNVTFMLPGGGTMNRTYQVAPNSRFTITVDALLPSAEVSTHVHSNKKIAVERAMYFNGRRAGHDSIGVSSPGTTWYLAEGYTDKGFDEYVLIQNPGEKEAKITATFMTPGTGNQTRSYTVGPHSRFTIHVDEILPAAEVSTQITSSQPVVVERAQYLNNMKGGTCSIAARSTSRTWYLAEGYTDQGFEEYILVQNPNNAYNNITVTFMEKNGANTVRNYMLPPLCRFTIGVDDILKKSEVSAKVRSEKPVLAERAMYWNKRSDGHACIGTPTPDTSWYLAEGYTAQGFETWILVQNPTDEVANVTFTFMEPSGRNTVKTYKVGPRTRFTVGVNEILPSAEVSTKVTADRYIIVERAVYFNRRSGGTDSLAIRGF